MILKWGNHACNGPPSMFPWYWLLFNPAKAYCWSFLWFWCHAELVDLGSYIWLLHWRFCFDQNGDYSKLIQLAFLLMRLPDLWISAVDIDWHTSRFRIDSATSLVKAGVVIPHAWQRYDVAKDEHTTLRSTPAEKRSSRTYPSTSEASCCWL